MQKILTFTIDSIAYDSKNVENVLNEACSGRREKYWVRGGSQVDENVYFLLLRQPKGRQSEKYHLAPLEDTTRDGMTSMLEQRWESGFDTITTIDLGEDTFLILVAECKNRLD